MIEKVSDIGNLRKVNEDSYGILEKKDYNVFIVCDGMGGHNAGEVASNMVKDIILDYMDKMFDKENPEKTLIKGTLKANKEVYTYSKTKYELKGMGTTITSVLAFDKNIFISHVGDSSFFRIRDKKINKLTKDHSYVQELLDLGKIGKDEAKSHPNKNIITRALGTNEEVKIDSFNLKTLKDDIYILTTDGLTDYLSEEEILEIILEYEDKGIGIQKLLDLAKDRGGKDNITILIFGGEALK